MFYNSIDLSGEILKKEWANSLKQEDYITEIFKCNLNKPLSPSQILKVYNDKHKNNVPITSIRRAMTDLTSKNILRKTSVTVKGLFGKNEFCWCMDSKEGVQIHWEF